VEAQCLFKNNKKNNINIKNKEQDSYTLFNVGKIMKI